MNTKVSYKNLIVIKKTFPVLLNPIIDLFQCKITFE